MTLGLVLLSYLFTCFKRDVARAVPRALLLCWIAVATANAPSWAQKPVNTTAGEVAMLPEYCRDTMSFGYGDSTFNTSPRAPKWVSLMGKHFWDMHHYCWALIHLRRVNLMPASSPQRAGLLVKIVSDYMYVISRAEPNFVMLPELYTRLGEAKILQNDVGGALEAYAMAREIKPDYWPAYSQWAEFLLKLGMRADAKRILESGLQHAPNATALVDLYRSLGEDPAKIRPIRSSVVGPTVDALPRPSASAPRP